MKRALLVLSIILFLTNCKSSNNLNKIVDINYEKHFISSGDNFPQISLDKNLRYRFLAGLHYGFSQEEIRQKLNWSRDDLRKEITLLKENGYLKEKSGILYPSISIVTNNQGINFFKKAEPIAKEIAASITKIEALIKNEYTLMETSKKHAFSEFAFFIFSDVLLDNWQINNVESDFLKEKRTLRHGKRYYIQYAEKDATYTREVFGIYGNQYKCNKELCFITYGNNRKNHYKSIEEMNEMDIPLLSKNDQSILKKMANIYKPILIDLLEKHKATFEKEYKNSVYYNELTFSEYFIWYYHFLYTRATDILAKNQKITIPESGVFRVKIEK